MFNRVILLVLDSVGIGELPDADKFGDAGSNTLVNTADVIGGINLPTLDSIGLSHICNFKGGKKSDAPKGLYGKMRELSNAKDTISGHWEMMGVIQETAFPVYPKGFPKELISEFEASIGRKVLGNYPASGTEIIKELGKKHIETGFPIVYTSADSVFQIAVHDEIMSLEELYSICLKARTLLKYPHNICRVIARPFKGTEGNFVRTKGRKDFALPPHSSTVLDILMAAGVNTVGIGKIGDIFCEKGLTCSYKTVDNNHTFFKTKEILLGFKSGFIFVNFNDFDTIYGHRNDPKGYAEELERFDANLLELLDNANHDDLIIITADHGCDPTTLSTDHSREYVPLLIYTKGAKVSKNIGVRKSFCDIGATIIDAFKINTSRKIGDSFYNEILEVI